MRILWASDAPTSPTGFGNITRALSAGLARLGHQVAVVGGRARRGPSARSGVTTLPGDGRDLDLKWLRYLPEFRPDVLVTVLMPSEAAAVAGAIERVTRPRGMRWVLY